MDITQQLAYILQLRIHADVDDLIGHLNDAASSACLLHYHKLHIIRKPGQMGQHFRVCLYPGLIVIVLH